MRLRRLKNGRIKDMDTGLFVNKKLAKSFANGKKIPLLKSKKSTKRSSRRSKHNTPHAYKKWTIRFYKPITGEDFGIDFGNRGASDEELLYLSYYFKAMANEDVKRDAERYSHRFHD